MNRIGLLISTNFSFRNFLFPVMKNFEVNIVFRKLRIDLTIESAIHPEFSVPYILKFKLILIIFEFKKRQRWA